MGIIFTIQPSKCQAQIHTGLPFNLSILYPNAIMAFKVSMAAVRLCPLMNSMEIGTFGRWGISCRSQRTLW